MGLLKPKLAPYNMRMANHTTIKLMGLICELKIYAHNIPYVITFIVLHNNVIDASYSMLLRRPWLKDAKVTHDWGNNTMMIQGNGTFITIIMTKHLGAELKWPKMLWCYNYQNGITDEEKDIIFAIEPKLFFMGMSTIKWAKPNSFVLFKRVRTWNWKLRWHATITQNLWFNHIFDLYNIFL